MSQVEICRIKPQKEYKFCLSTEDQNQNSTKEILIFSIKNVCYNL